MIINIPLQIDEAVIEKNLSVDYENKIKDYIFTEVKDILIQRGKEKYRYSWNGNVTASDGLELYVRAFVEDCILNWKDEIIEAASDKLADRLARTKAAKELIKEV